ncbi:DUF6544 family protein [Kocuria sp. SM24M-10]|uniref:DUF6544 family protein n=1 Tax=Kocuria sp. SM24M-10 TaxID=1660349 RepID=UPI00069B0D62|nr:DUF6544 family protein [Kocuria sp. SM24M-10]
MTRPLPRAARRHWAALERTGSPAPPAAAPAALAGLPEPARRWLARAVPPGTPVWSMAELRMRGEIRLGGRWRAFSARQLLAPGVGFVWAARTRVLGLPVTGFDRYGADEGELRWRLLGVVPVLSATGPDITRSAAGRLAGEGVLVPPACVRAAWSAGTVPGTAVMSWVLDGTPEECLVRVDPEGRLVELRMQRWGDPDGTGSGRHPFGVALSAEKSFDGVRVPTALRAGWGWGTDRQAEGEFFRARIEDVRFR